MFGMAMMLPNLGFQASGTAGGSLPVGSIAGGGLPTNTAIQTLSLSLSLLPLGLIAVAVFPPFARFAHLYFIMPEPKVIIHKSQGVSLKVALSQIVFTLAEISKRGCQISSLSIFSSVVRGELCHPFLEISAKVKDFLRLNHL